jgi:hypothetical protein
MGMIPDDAERRAWITLEAKTINSSFYEIITSRSPTWDTKLAVLSALAHQVAHILESYSDLESRNTLEVEFSELLASSRKINANQRIRERGK